MRLIDADKIPYTEMDVGLGDGMYDVVKVAYECDIDATPTVDAVPVIRCKDCKKFVKEEDQTYCIDMFGQCDENGFCSWAERKDNETD